MDLRDILEASRHPMEIGLGQKADTSIRFVVMRLVGSQANMYANLHRVLLDLEDALGAIGKARQSLAASLANATKKEIAAAGGNLLDPFTVATMAITAAVNISAALAKQGINPSLELKKAIVGIADALNHTEAARRAFSEMRMSDLVSRGLVPQAGLKEIAGRAGIAGDIASNYVGHVVVSWAKAINQSTDTITSSAEKYLKTLVELHGKVRAAAKDMKLAEGVDFKLGDPALILSLRSKMLDEAMKVHDEVKARRKPADFASDLFNAAIDLASTMPIAFFLPLSAFVVEKFSDQTLKIDTGLSRAAFASARLLDAATKITAAAAEAYAATFTKFRVVQKQTESTSQAAAEAAMKSEIRRVGTREYDEAYAEIEAYRNYAKTMKDIMEGWGSAFGDLPKYLLMAAGIIGAAIVIK